MKPNNKALSKATQTQTTSPGLLKPLLLSAGLFPGLGQLAQGKKFLGVLIISLSALCLFIVFSEAVSEINAAAQRMAHSGSMDYMRAHQESQNVISRLKTTRFLIALNGMIGLWLFSIVNVFMKRNT